VLVPRRSGRFAMPRIGRCRFRASKRPARLSMIGLAGLIGPRGGQSDRPACTQGTLRPDGALRRCRSPNRSRVGYRSRCRDRTRRACPEDLRRGRRSWCQNPAMVPEPLPGGGVYDTEAPACGVKETVIERRAASPGSRTPLGLPTGVLVPATTSIQFKGEVDGLLWPRAGVEAGSGVRRGGEKEAFHGPRLLRWRKRAETVTDRGGCGDDGDGGGAVGVCGKYLLR
jgi:hypothetical protein